jgi:hypothetical protein
MKNIIGTSTKQSPTFRLGIVGHRYIANTETVAFVAESCLAILKRLQAEHENLTVISAIAEGADTIFAEKAVELNIPLEIVRPFEDYAIDFTTASAKQRYERLRSWAHSETILNYAGRSDAAYLAGMHWIVDNSSLLIAVWDGSPARGLGGTGDAIERALSLNRDWIHIDVANLSVACHLKSERER